MLSEGSPSCLWTEPESVSRETPDSRSPSPCMPVDWGVPPSENGGGRQGSAIRSALRARSRRYGFTNSQRALTLIRNISDPGSIGVGTCAARASIMSYDFRMMGGPDMSFA